MSDLLVITLEAAVPLRIHEVRDWTAEERIEAARAAAPVLASHGDDLQFGGKHTQEAFAALVTGLACLAYQPGGVRFMGCSWEAGICGECGAAGPRSEYPTTPHAPWCSGAPGRA